MQITAAVLRAADGPYELGAEVASRWFGQLSFATHVVATARNVVAVDEGLPLEKLGPLGCTRSSRA